MGAIVLRNGRPLHGSLEPDSIPAVRAALTMGRGTMEIADVSEPREPGAGEAIVRPEAVGLCGSDFHYFLGDIGTMGDSSSLYPRIQGHEFSALVEELGPGSPPELRTGDRVAIWPVRACGHCYPCSIGRGNVCENLSLVGVHRDGALQERLLLPTSELFRVGDQDAAVTALVEPVSIAVRSVERGRVAAGEHVLVLGAGPIGQALTLAATDKGASVLLVDRLEHRLELGRALGAETLVADARDDWMGDARNWSGGGAEVVFEATGVPALVATAMTLVRHAGRVVVVGLSDQPAPVRVGDLPFRELDLIGVSCCANGDFAGAVDLVGRRRELASGLVTHQFPFEEAPEAMRFAIDNPAEAMKVVVRVDR
jgi:threonine dehydrogenase-like Zn-dependent dehydrogenase